MGIQKTFNTVQASPALSLAGVSVGNNLNSDNKFQTNNPVQTYASVLSGNISNSNSNKPFVFGAEKSASIDLGSPTPEKI